MGLPEPTKFTKILFGSDITCWSERKHWFTRYRYVTSTGIPPRLWPVSWHERTQWKHYTQPIAELVSVHSNARFKVTRSEKYIWPESLQHSRIRKQDLSNPSIYGIAPGFPIQMGTDTDITIVHDKGRTKVPIPADGYYWISGHPGAKVGDCCVIAPSGDTYEIGQLDTTTGAAHSVGRFRSGNLIQGETLNKSGVSVCSYVWDRRSSVYPHTLGLYLPPPVGTDRDPVPRIGDMFSLDPDSKSARIMLNFGGECSKLAEALMTYGVRVVDWAPEPTVLIQAGTWPNSNINQFTIAVHDLLYVTAREVL